MSNVKSKFSVEIGSRSEVSATVDSENGTVELDLDSLPSELDAEDLENLSDLLEAAKNALEG